VAKPEAFIFETALAQHGVRPEQAWHVGDDWTEDYQGALAAGLQGVWLNRDRIHTRTATLEIGNLSMLQAILHP
jgi:FMN phosphatase YigB (HAD superfamily)